MGRMGFFVSIGLVYAVHGFLGQASDWDGVRQVLTMPCQFVAEDLFSRNLNSEKVSQVIAHKGRKIFLGYSLGGRMGLKILNDTPDLFDHYIFLSTNSGLADDATQDRRDRLESDTEWAEQISESNWLNFVREWNEQRVFAGSAEEPKRNLSFFDTFKLKQSLLEWSLAKQPDYSYVIRRHKNKITWVVGEKDSKFTKIARELHKNDCLESFVTVKGSGHRIWLDQPVRVAEIVKNCLK